MSRHHVRDIQLRRLDRSRHLRKTSTEQQLLRELEAAGIHVCEDCQTDLLTLCASELHRP